jgi:hypothetical protein
MGIFGWLWNGVRQVIGLVLPIFAKATDFRNYGREVRLALHVFVLVVILTILAVLQNMPTWPGPPLRDIIRNKYIYRIWLPGLFLLLYTMMWLAWWLWRILFSEEEASEWQDIDSAWKEAKGALEQTGIDLQSVPLFLVLGQPAAGESGLFEAAKLPFTVKQVPARDAPLHVWANKQDGIFVTCAEASRLGSRASYLAVTGGAAVEEEDLTKKTIGAGTGGSDSALHGIIGGLMDVQLTLQQRVQRYKALERAQKPEEDRRLTARLEHLCRLLVRDRWPEPPINGILVLIPYAATCSDAAADLTSRDCQQDLASAWRVFRLHCPLFALVCDLETVPGFAAFLDAYLAGGKTEEKKREARKRRLGRGLGWGVGLDPESRRRTVAAQVDWIGRTMLPKLIYGKDYIRLETPGREDLATAVRNNSQLCRFMGAMYEGQKRLTRIVLQGLMSKTSGPDLLGGCYLAATGRDAANEQAFVAQVFEGRLVASIRHVAWSQEALDEEARYHQWTSYGYMSLPVFVVAVIVLVYLWWP